MVSKHKLEMLPGNGTIVLDTVWMINLTIKSNVSTDHSSSVKSAIFRMYQTVARLIKLCDDVLIDDKSSELNMENVNDIVAQVEDAVKVRYDTDNNKSMRVIFFKSSNIPLLILKKSNYTANEGIL